MSIDSVTSYNPNNVNDTLYAYQSNRTVGTNPIQQVPKTNYASIVSLDTPPDTFELSAESKIKKNKENGISKLALSLIGIGGLFATAFVTHKIVHPKNIQKQVQSIFLEDFTKEEALAIQKKYQDILKIQDKDEFIDRMVNALKKDYKLEDIPIVIDKTYKSGTTAGAIQGAAHMSPHYISGNMCVGIDRNCDTKSLLRSLAHEFRHIKQDKIGHQVVSREELINIFKDRMNDFAKYEGKPSEFTIKDYEEMADEALSFYKKLGIKPISPNDKNYDWARKVMDSYRIYANKSKDAYHSVFYETDAKSTGNLMSKMVNNRLF